MYLKSLEIIGFKSFPEKIDLKFSQGITAVVGPNGCGKSNLVDAIRWALGEQRSRLMRGAKMEELLFSGTTKRKALNFAEVSLVFDEVDKLIPVEYHEVAVTRRMYRSGEGEYYLNKTACRLKDVLELFWDTGIGTDTYSIIGQGRVEQIISSRPEERREIFEEAAEIHKYKEKKKETSYRLAEMKGNMLRVEDLLAELRGGWGELSAAASLAGEYRLLQSRLQEIEQKLFEQRWEKNRGAAVKLEGESIRLEELLREKRANLQNLSEKLARLAAEETLVSHNVEDKQKAYQAGSSRVDDLRHRCVLLQEQRKFAAERSIIKEDAYREINSRLEGIEKSYRENEEELQGVHREQEEAGRSAARLQAAVQNLRSGALHASREKIKEELALYRSGRAVLEQSAKDADLRRREHEERLAALERKREEKRLEAEKWGEEEKKARGLFTRLQMELEDLQKESGLQENLYRDASTRFMTQKDEYVRRAQELEKKTGRLKLLRENEDSFSAYGAGVRAVMGATGRAPFLKGIYGPAAGLIKAPREFEKAVEVALGASLQYIVVEDDQAAREAIAYLKDKKAGRATFLPLTLLKVPPRKEIPPAPDGFLYQASKVAAAEEKYKKAIDYLLGGTLIAKNLDDALHVLRGDRGGWRFVTLDGEMLTPGGAITGGARSGEQSGFLQRKRELSALQEETFSLQDDLRIRKEKLSEEEAKPSVLMEGLNRLALKQKTCEEELAQSGASLGRCRLERERSARELQSLEPERLSLNEKYRLLQEEGEKIAAGLKAGEEDLERLESELTRTGEQVEQEESAGKQLEEELLEIRIKFSALQEKESSCQELLRKQALEKEDLTVMAASVSRERERALAEMQDLEAREQDLLQKLEMDKAGLELAEQNLMSLTGELNLCRREKETLEMEKEKQQRSLERHERRSYQLELEQTRFREEKRYLSEFYRERYGADPETIPPIQADESEEGLQAEKERISAQILTLGDVAPGAIEEFERLRERVDFLETQQSDLLQGEQGMRKVIAELDQEMERRFLQALQIIEKFFLDAFAGLFGGGQALIKLTDPGHVLESGIEIIAQPPGKKLQNITLLSGGEKALTSIALLFALLQYKPVPFCVLDEIDSSLDESNIERFISFLKKYSLHSQFILITHRQKTMEEADVLYGVTMEEQGISKILSINLTEKAG